MKLKKVLSLILCVCMVLGMMSTVTFADENPVEVTTYEGLIEALAEENANVIMMNDITATATQSNGYGKAGIVVAAGDILDGNGKTLTINGANSTWDSVIGMKGGTVKNLTVAGAMRGIFMPGANGDVVIDNCVFKDVIYTFNSDAGSKDYTVTVKNSALNGWTSFSNVHKSVTFENCTFGEGSGYAFCRPYNETTFTGCEFNEGFKIDMIATQTFNECKYDGEALGVNNINKLFIDDNDGKNVIIDNEEVTLNKKAKAYIGLTGYEELSDAIKAAVNGDIITLVNDYAGDVTISKNITLDGANKNYTGKITISGNYNVSIKNVNFVGGDHYAIETSGPNTVTVEKCTINNYSYGFFYAKKSTANVVIKDVTVENCNYGFSWNYGINATLENVKMTNVKYGVFVQNWADKTVTLKNCEILATYPVFVWEKDAATQTFVLEGENNFGTTEFAISDYAALKLADADATLTACADLEVATDNEKYNVIYENGVYKIEKLVKIGETYYPCLQEAICAAQPGDTITLLGNITERVIIEAPAVAAIEENETPVVIDLAGYTLNGYILIQDASKVIEIKDGNIVNEYSDESAIESNANITLTNVNITSARHAVNIEGSTDKKAIAEINGGNYSLITSAGKTQNVIGAEYAQVTINGGVFVGPVGTASDSGAAVAAKDGADVTINGGKFSGGKNNTLSKNDTATLVVNGGSFDQDPSAYLADEFAVETTANGYYKVAEANKVVDKIKVEFEVPEDAEEIEGEKVYNINLTADGNVINRLNSVDLTFLFTQVEGANEYEIIASNSEVAINPVDNSKVRYEFHYNGKTDVTTDTNATITIGQVKFTGYGKFSFAVDSAATTNVAHATKLFDNIVDAFVPGGVLADGTKVGDFDVTTNFISDVIAIPVRDLSIKIDFPNAVVDQAIAYQDMKVVISGGDLAENITIDLGSDAQEDAKFVANFVDGSYVINVTDALTVNNAYTVTVSGAGYRTARYTVTMTEDKALRFWNNVMDEEQVVEIGKDSSTAKVTFLAGDIVKDNNINIYDLSAVVSYFGSVSTTENGYAKYDLNRDGVIDSKDVAYVLVSWNN